MAESNKLLIEALNELEKQPVSKQESAAPPPLPAIKRDEEKPLHPHVHPSQPQQLHAQPHPPPVYAPQAREMRTTLLDRAQAERSYAPAPAPRASTTSLHSATSQASSSVYSQSQRGVSSGATTAAGLSTAAGPTGLSSQGMHLSAGSFGSRQLIRASPFQPVVKKPELQNIVSTANLCCQLDLRKIAMKSRNAEYNPRRFAAVIMRIRDPKTTALIFHSGKIVCTGAKSEQQSKTAAMKYAQIIKMVGFDVKFKDFKVQNIVASCSVPYAVRLESLASVHKNFASYEPEIFPGLIYRMYEPKVVLLIFVSGKVVLTGAKTREEIDKAFENIVPVLSDNKKKK